MSELLIVVLVTLAAGLAMPFGALISQLEHIRSQRIEKDFRHGMMAFGGGALLSAVALVLVPEGIIGFSPLSASIWLLLGGISFMALDIYLCKKNTPASQLAAMLSDFIPESLALGAAFALGKPEAFLLAGLMALQNLPEGFNASRELRSDRPISIVKIIIIFSLMALLGPIFGVSGFLWLADYPLVINAVMLFASGGILYSVFQDIAPQAKLDKHWSPAVGAVLGFILGVVGLMLTQ